MLGYEHLGLRVELGLEGIPNLHLQPRVVYPEFPVCTQKA